MEGYDDVFLLEKHLVEPLLGSCDVAAVRTYDGNNRPVFYDECIASLFSPKSIAVVGATDRPGIGRITLANIKGAGTKAAVWGINPGRKVVLGQPCFPSVKDCPSVPDLVVIVTPAPTVPAIVQQCVDIRVKAIIVISSGFKEVGPAGKLLEDQISASLHSTRYTRLVGPNCLGIHCSYTNLNTTFGSSECTPGNCAVASQSGAVICTILDWALQNGIGFSSMVSVGSMLDVTWAELLLYFGNDPNTKFIVIYMESIGNAEAFMAAAQQVTLRKPVIVLKAGRTDEAAKAAMSHTGTLAGSDHILDVAFKRVGVIRVDSITEIYSNIMMFSFSPIPRGPNVAVVTHAGGPGVISTDTIAQCGGKLATIPKSVIDSLNPLLPKNWSMTNPLDLSGGASPECYQYVLDALSQLEDVHSVMAIVAPLSGICPGTPVAQYLKQFKDRCPDKTLVVGMLGGDELLCARKALIRNHIAAFNVTDITARTITAAWNYRKTVMDLHQPPKALPRLHDHWKATSTVNELLSTVQATGRTILTEAESKTVLEAYGIPITKTIPTRSVEEALSAANSIGYPVVLKLLSETITHKSDVGGVLLNIDSDEAVRLGFETIKMNLQKCHPDTWQTHFLGVTVQPMINASESLELLLGSHTDAQLGPVVVFGTGGKLVEVFKDTAVGLPPLDATLVEMMMKQTKIFKALGGVRGSKPVDLDKLMAIIISFGDMISNHPLIKECDINPLLASSQRITAVDGRIVLWPQSTSIQSIPKAVIKPYAYEFVRDITMTNGAQITVRMLRVDDCAAWQAWGKLATEDTAYTSLAMESTKAQRFNFARTTRILFSCMDSFGIVALDTPGHILAGIRIIKYSHAQCVCSPVFSMEQIGTELFKHILQHTCHVASHYTRCSEISAVVPLTRHNAPWAHGAAMAAAFEAFGFKADPKSTSELRILHFPLSP
ncbi:acetyl-coenzym A synthetase [Pelomyxa schiedti]|nr:acetyl-coenzym A synthetase [Pelomyxa schiedti]